MISTWTQLRTEKSERSSFAAALAQVDGARRDLLETISHGPRGDIVSIYTTFPWPALCAEVAKLNIHLREGKVLDGGFQSLATGFATAQLSARNRWRKLATPTGFESSSNVAKPSEDSVSPSENSRSPDTKKRFTKGDGSKVAKLAILAANAVKNVDLHRALELIEEIRAVGEGGDASALPARIRAPR